LIGSTANPKYGYKQDEVFNIVAEFQIKNPTCLIGPCSNSNKQSQPLASPASVVDTTINEQKAQKLFQGASVGKRFFVRPIEELAALESTEVSPN